MNRRDRRGAPPATRPPRPGSHAVNRRETIAVAIAFAGALLAVGLPYWTIPPDRLALPRDVQGLGLLIGAMLAAGACAFTRVSAWAAGLAVAVAVPGAVMLRVIVDVIRDPTTHNLWPFELVLAAGPGLVAGLGGALVGALRDACTRR